MTGRVLADGLVVYSVQVAVVAALAAMGGALMRPPAVWGRLAYWRFVAFACLLLPWISVGPTGPGPLGVVAAVATSVSTAAVESTDRLSPSLSWLLVVVICTGIAMRLSWLAVGWRQLQELVDRSTGRELDRGLESLRRALAPHAVIRFASELTQPVTFGWRRAVVVLPGDLGDLPSDQQRAVLCHELLHVARQDWISVWVEEMLRSVFWFHPAMRYAVAQMQLGREEIVDAAVVSQIGHRRTYMEALLRFATRRERPAPGLPLIRERHLLRRMRALREGGTMSRIRIVITAAISILWIAGTALAVGGHAAARTSQQVYFPGNGVSLPVVVKQVHPEYTSAAKEAKIQGSVYLDCVVRPDGAPSDIVVAGSLDTTYGLDTEAVQALRRWRFAPGRKNGKPVAVKVSIEMRFSLKRLK